MSDRVQRYVLRVSEFLSVAEVRAEHRILLRLRQGALPFHVPEPVAAPAGQTVVATPAGAASFCRWLPGVRPGMEGEAAFERFGRTAGQLSTALANVPLGIARRDWRTDPRWVLPDDPTVDVLCGELRSAGMSAALTELLDFEFAGAGFRAQDILAALYNSTALDAPDWRRRTSAFLRGWVSVRRLEPAEVAALPELLIARSLGSVLWRAARWRRGGGCFGQVTARAGRLEETTRWLATNEDEFMSVATEASF